MAIKCYRDVVNTSPSEVQDGDAFAIKVVAVAGYNNDYAIYAGDSNDSDEEVARNGAKLCAGESPFQWLMQCREYRR